VNSALPGVIRSRVIQKGEALITVSIDPVLLSIGHFHLRWYSLIVLTAIAVGTWLTAKEADRKGFSAEDIYDAAIWVILAGLVGARLFHVVDHWPDRFAANPIQALYIWEGGLAIWGGVAGGLIAVAVLAKRKHWRLPRLLDAVAPGLVLAQAIGRVACIITGDSVGKPTNGPFGLAYTSPNAAVPQLGVFYTPMPIYEILMNLGILAVLWRLRRRRSLPDGALFFTYLILYSGIRFGITFWSSYRITAFGLNQSQIVSLVGLAVGIPALISLLRHGQAESADDLRRPQAIRPSGATRASSTSKGEASMTKSKRQQRREWQLRERRLRSIGFVVVVLVVLGSAGYLLVGALFKPAPPPMAGNVIEVAADMSGFDKTEIRVKAGQPVTVRLTSLDNSHHTDGGGKHQWAVDELGLDIIAPPEGSNYVTFTPDAPGSYTFYCDVCCGGRANPSMQGTLMVEA